MKSSRCLVAALTALLAAGCSRPAPQKSFIYVEEVSVQPQGAKTRLWLPVPPSDDYQSVELIGVDSSAPLKLTKEAEFGNSMYYLESDGKEPMTIKLSYKIVRRTQTWARRPGAKPLTAEKRKLYSSPRGLVRVNKRIRKLAAETAGDRTEPMDVARSFYDYIMDYMAYNKIEPGWGNGDSDRACIVGLGNCTDFHSLFQAMAMAKDIPSRFRMGLPLNNEAKQELGKVYHCWAEFHDERYGWVPMDISEAWKVKAGLKKWDESWVDRYFGTLDEQRLLLSTGRELTLQPPQDGPPLNYFAYPYLEVAGEPTDKVSFKRTVSEI